ncbi:MAG: MlaD family protein, partial [Candidatus Omnitrophota bacterium]
MKKFANELKTGLMVLMAILVGLFLWLKTVDFRPDVYDLKTYFSHAEGIKESSIVMLAGIEVGTVGGVEFLYNPGQTKIKLDLIIDKAAKVRADSIAFIGTTGFIGDAYI